MNEVVRVKDIASPKYASLAAAGAAIGFALLCIFRPDALTLIVNLPAPVLLLVSIATSVALVAAGQLYVHHRFKYQDFVTHNEVAGFIVSIVGTLYAVILGFLILIAWQHYFDARQLVAAESAAAADAWHVALDLPKERRTRVRRDLVEYSNRMVYDEWPQMRTGGEDERSAIIIMDAIGAAGNFKPLDLGQANSQVFTLQQLGAMHDDRQRRLADNSSAISPFEWLVLLIGGSCVIGFCWLFGLSNPRVHLLMTAAVTIIITSTLVLLFELQFPFRTSLAITATDWSAVIEHIQLMQRASPMNMRM